MNRFAVSACLVLALAGCRRTETPPAPQPVRGESGTLETDNRLNLVFGATVIDRDNENNLESSAAQAIDGSDFTAWTSAPGGPLTGVFALPAATRLTKLGAAVPASETAAVVTLRIETSPDGTTWTKTLASRLAFKSEAPQLFDVQPVTARYLRVTLDSPEYSNSILSLHAVGSEVEPHREPALDGCWEINGQPARFTRTGSRVMGTIGSMLVDGGVEDRVYRLMWLDEAMWGFAAVTVSPDAQHLSGVRWHEEVNPKHNGDGWFGRRVPCQGEGPIDATATVARLFARTGTWRLYGIRFDGQDRIVSGESASALDLAAQQIASHPDRRFRIVGREFRAATEAANRGRAAAKLQAVRAALEARGADMTRVEFVNAGTARDALAVDFTSQRVMDSGVDLQLVPR